MIEIAFDKLTKRHIENLKKKENGINDIYLFGTLDDIGPLKSAVPHTLYSTRLRYRTKIHNAYEISYQKVNPEYYEYLYLPFREWFDESVEDTKRVKDFLTAGEELRVWSSNMAIMECGLAHLCYSARDSKSKIYIVRCPDDKPFDKYGNTHWANINPDHCLQYTELIQELSADERNEYSELWQRLTEENSNLRIIKDGKVISVPDDYFDGMIQAEIDKGHRTHTALLGSCMNFLPEYVNYNWLCYRIEVLEKGVDDIPCMPFDVYEAHELCSKNKEALSKADKCGCFFCERIFDPKEVYEYLSGEDTAFCPHCGIDSVIPENDKYPLTPEFLKLMREYWFWFNEKDEMLE